MRIPLPEAAAAMGSTAAPPAMPVSGWSVDTRTIQPGDVFFALRGPTHDGRRFVEQAFAAGAAGAVVERETAAGGVQIPVPDTYEALRKLAHWARRRWGGRAVAVTGSAGKTTTKDAIAHLLGTKMPVGKTAGNLNNHVGLPLSILRLADDARVAVLELGMNHAGEIRQLAGIAAPDIGVVTNAGYAHAESFDSIDDIARAKRELVEMLPPDGTAVLNADDQRVAAFGEIHPGPVVTFGFSPGAGVQADAMERTPDGARFHVAGAGWFESRLEGRHGVMNLLAALAVARVFGLEPADLAEAVASFEAGEMRGRRFTHQGVTILNDCYNSNPEAVRAMLDTLREIPARRRIAVLGEMRELGRWTEPLHQEIGRQVAACGVHVLVGIRGAARDIAETAVQAGLPASAAFFFSDPEPAGDFLKEIAREGDAVLFKGSRGTHVERALERFMQS